MKFYTHLDRPSALFGNKVSARGSVGRSASSVNFGFFRISETIGARKLRFYTRLDKAKYSFRYDNFSARARVGERGDEAPLV